MMKTFKKLLYLLPLLVLFLFAFAGCGRETGVKKIGIMQIVEHESLDSAK
jgi:ABC-type uncharacterized transport system substrate-binding protein